MKILAVLCLALALTGCARMTQDLAKPGTDTIRCDYFGFGLIGTPIAMIEQWDCVRKYEKLGYVQIPPELATGPVASEHPGEPVKK
jgi:hypothetical protein